MKVVTDLNLMKCQVQKEMRKNKGKIIIATLTTQVLHQVAKVSCLRAQIYKESTRKMPLQMMIQKSMNPQIMMMVIVKGPSLTLGYTASRIIVYRADMIRWKMKRFLVVIWKECESYTSYSQGYLVQVSNMKVVMVMLQQQLSGMEQQGINRFRQMGKTAINNEIGQEEIMLKIIAGIRATYCNTSTTQEVRESQKNMAGVLQAYPNTLQLLLQFVKANSSKYLLEENFRVACANLIKKECLKISHNVQNYTGFIQNMHEYIFEWSQPHKLKQIIGKGLQQILSTDCSNIKFEITNGVIQKITTISLQNWNMQFIQQVFSLMQCSIICINTLEEPTQYCDFLLAILHKVISIGSVCLDIITKNINNCSEEVYEGTGKIFQFIKKSVGRVLDERELLGSDYNDIMQILTNNNVFYEYLIAFNVQGSVICRYEQLNDIKYSILQYLQMIYEIEDTPKIFINLFFVTYLKSYNCIEYNNNELQTQVHIISICIRILQINITKQTHYDFFITHKYDLLFTIFMYSKTTQEQLQLMKTNHNQFVQVSTEYSSAFSTSHTPKIKSASLLKAFTKNVDEIRPIILQYFKSWFPLLLEDQFPAMNKEHDFITKTNNKQKLQIMMMILTVIESEVVKYPSQYKQLLYCLMSQAHKIHEMKDELLVLRFIRLIGYYPNALFYGHITSIIKNNPTGLYMLQGLQTFDKISKNKQYIQGYKQIYQIFIVLLDYIQVQSNIFQSLIMLNYNSIVKHSHKLINKIVQKLRVTFLNRISNINSHNNKHIIMRVLNYVDKLLYYGVDTQEIYRSVYEMEDKGLHISILEDNFIGIELAIVNNINSMKMMHCLGRAEQLVLGLCVRQRLNNLSIYCKYFVLVNKILTFHNTVNRETVQMLYRQMVQYIGHYNKEQYNKQIIPHICHTLSFILIRYYQGQADYNFINYLLQLIKQVKNNDNRIWFTLLLMHFIYKYPKEMLNSYGQQLLSLALNHNSFRNKVQRKIVVFSLCQLLSQKPTQTQAQTILVTDIFKYCTHILKQQHEAYKEKVGKRLRRAQENSKIRRMMVLEIQTQAYSKQERMQEEMGEHRDEYSELSQLYHPFDNISEYEHFRGKVHAYPLRNMLGQKELSAIKEVLCVDWVNNATRMSVRVKTHMNCQ